MLKNVFTTAIVVGILVTAESASAQFTEATPISSTHEVIVSEEALDAELNELTELETVITLDHDGDRQLTRREQCIVDCRLKYIANLSRMREFCNARFFWLIKSCYKLQGPIYDEAYAACKAGCPKE